MSNLSSITHVHNQAHAKPLTLASSQHCKSSSTVWGYGWRKQ